jgi:hypothetical protein
MYNRDLFLGLPLAQRNEVFGEMGDEEERAEEEKGSRKERS